MVQRSERLAEGRYMLPTDSPLLHTPERILLAGDTHGDLSHVRKLMEFAVECRAEGIIQLGDFGIWPGEGGRMYLRGLARLTKETGIWIAFIDGNHEDFEQLYSMPVNEHGVRPVTTGVWHLPRGLRWNWNGRTWLAMGGAVSLDRRRRKPFTEWWPQEAITMAEFGRAIDDDTPVDVMLSHDCPMSVDIPDLPSLSEGWFSPEALAEAHAHREILQAIADSVTPKELYHGHFHIRYEADVEFEGRPCIVNGLGANGMEVKATAMVIDVSWE